MKCSRCQEPYTNTTKGKSSYCPECRREYDRDWYAKNRERVKVRKKIATAKKRQTIREWITNYLLENPCVDCGETDPIVLEFDHRGDKLHNVSDMLWSHGLSSIQAEIAKCDVRCANCHRRKTHRVLAQWEGAPFGAER